MTIIILSILLLVTIIAVTGRNIIKEHKENMEIACMHEEILKTQRKYWKQTTREEMLHAIFSEGSLISEHM